MDNIQEIWKDVVGYEGHYRVSSLGRVKSLKFNREKILSLRCRGDGRIDAYLTMDGLTSTYSVHRLVAIAFIPNPQKKPTVNHKNGLPDDNTVENLEWATNLENNLHSIHVLGNIGISRPAHHRGNKITKEIAEHIRASTDKAIDLAMRFGVHRNYIHQIKRGMYWS